MNKFVLTFTAILGFASALSVDAGTKTERALERWTRMAGIVHSKHKPTATPTSADPWWDLNGTTAGAGTTPNGTWSTSVANWNPVSAGTSAVANWVNGNAAVFSAGTDATGSYTVTVSGTVTASSITFEEGAVTLAGTSTPVLTISGVGGVTINSTINGTTTFDSTVGNVVLSANQDWANNSSQAFNINSGVVTSGNRTLTLNGSGSGGATFAGVLANGTGTLALTVDTTGGVTILSGDNTYSGNTTVTAGVLNIRHGDALGDTGSATTTKVSSGAALEIQGGIAVDNENLNTLAGTGISNGGALRNVSGDNSWAGTITLADVAGAVRINSDSGTLTISGNIGEMGAANKILTFGGAGNVTVNGVISAGAMEIALVKDGAGTLTLTGANAYAAGTTVSGGTLLANNTTGSGTGSGAVTVSNSGTVLGGTGTISGAVTVNANAKVQGGTGTTGATQKLTLTGGLTLADNSIIQLALGPSGTHSTLARTGSNTWTFDSNQAFTFIDLGATTGTYQDIITGIANPPSEGSWTITNAGWAGTFTYDGANIDLTLTAVPEPSTWVAGGLALSALLLSQRRRISRLVRRC